MCRLFGLSGGSEPVRATFWLLEARDSLAVQSRRDPDGTGIGWFEDGRACVDKRPVAAYEDREFAERARELCSTTYVAHIRFASTGGLKPQNTHPFCQDGRLFAHNGVLADLDRLDDELGGARELVHGDTDSERFFALVTKRARANGGDVEEALVSAACWTAAHLPLYALNVILTIPGELWALRYPDTHGLYVLERGPGGPTGARHLDQSSAAGSVRVRSGELRDRASVVVASEPMDEDPGWRELDSGELVHVAPDLTVERRRVLTDAPVDQLTLADLDPRAAASQAKSEGGPEASTGHDGELLSAPPHGLPG
jgi:glutamine amidotransferase